MTLRQALEVGLVCMPVSTMAQPSPSLIAQTLMNCSAPVSGMRIQKTPGAISWASPSSGEPSMG